MEGLALGELPFFSFPVSAQSSPSLARFRKQTAALDKSIQPMI
jgi:hypothetical protein